MFDAQIASDGSGLREIKSESVDFMDEKLKIETCDLHFERGQLPPSPDV